MKYQISNQVTKTGTKGDFVQCDLTDEQGNVFQKINLFNGEATGKNEIEGNLVQNGKYWNFKANIVHTANIPPRGGAIANAQIRKAENIEHAQDRKNDAIALAGSITNATNLVTHMMDAGILSPQELADVKGTIRNYIIWYQNLYKNPNEINPSSSAIPF